MRIGILTLPLHTNYGGILQAYALQTVLQRMGHEVVVIDRSHLASLKIYKKPFSYSKRFIQKYVLGKDTRIFIEQHHNETYPVISQYTQSFIDKYINCIEVDNLLTLKENDFDAIIVGSDQIWRPAYYFPIENAFLSFTKRWNIKRIAYAASFGTNQWEYTRKQTKLCGKSLRKFDAVSVREYSGVELCHKYFGIDAKHVLDPTLLLNAEDYIHIIKESKVSQSSGTLFVYILDETEEKKEIINKIVNEKGLIPFTVNSKTKDKKASLEELIQPPVEQWLRGFYDAEFIVTDSFHACVFSILFNKPFIAIGNKERGMTRFDSLLATLKLERLLINSIEDYQKVKEITFDYNDTNILLKKHRIISMDFLEKNNITN